MQRIAQPDDSAINSASAASQMSPDIMTQSGNFFNFIHPENSAFTIEDIAHALSHICRFTGHTRKFYSVAQHSVLVSTIVPPEHALAGLLHDAAEAMIGDVSSPLKALLPEYKVIERRVEAVILAHFGLAPVLPFDVKIADIRLLATERRDLMPRPDYICSTSANFTPLAQTIVPMAPVEAKAVFLARFYQITEMGEHP